MSELSNISTEELEEELSRRAIKKYREFMGKSRYTGDSKFPTSLKTCIKGCQLNYNNTCPWIQLNEFPEDDDGLQRVISIVGCSLFTPSSIEVQISDFVIIDEGGWLQIGFSVMHKGDVQGTLEKVLTPVLQILAGTLIIEEP
jgi:hypothetical protein